MFSTGEWVIDTKDKSVSTVLGTILNDLVYVLEDDEGMIYLSKSENLIKYDKYYFD